MNDLITMLCGSAFMSFFFMLLAANIQTVMAYILPRINSD